MIDFKKRLKEDRAKKAGLEADAQLVLAGAVQGLLHLVPAPPKLSVPEQSEIIVCQCCGHTWTSTEAGTIRKAWSQSGIPPRLGPLCDICWHLYSVTKQANARGLSLKAVVFRFLRGRAKQLHTDWKNLWTSPR